MPSPPPDRELPLYVLRVGDDDPKLCTGQRLLRRRLAAPPPHTPGRAAPLLLLDPYARDPVSVRDRSSAPGIAGILAVDCSWNRLGGRGRFDARLPRGLLRRRLPWLLAANPQHFGRPAELNTAEALGAALCLLGERGRGERLLAAFPGGAGFVPLNEPTLSAYAAAAGPDEVRAVERGAFGRARADRTPSPPSRGARRAGTRAPPGR